MTNLMIRLRRILDSESGQALAELSLVLAFVAIVCVAVLMAIGVAVVTPLENFVAGFD